MRFVFPNGLRKALTFSYDDGQAFDKKLIQIFNTYGMKGTFHLNSGKLGINNGHDNYVKAEEVASVYAGHEVAVHGVEHRNLPTLTRHQMVLELEEDRKALEELTGGMVQGMSYAFGSYNEEIMEVIKTLGIKYSRTVNATHGFFPPADFRAWHPTCHHDDNLLEIGDRFLDVPGFNELPIMYVWGHSFEFGWKNDYSVIEEFCKKMADKDDIWYATNIEICEYVTACRSQEFSADGKYMKNPTAFTVWVSTGTDFVEVKPGETKCIK